MEIILNAMDVLDIKCLDKKAVLTSTKTDRIPAFDYRRFSHGKTVFTVKEDEGFAEALAEGTVYSVKLNNTIRTVEIDGKDTEVPTIEFLNFVTARQKKGVVTMLGEITQLEKSFTMPVAAKIEEMA